ncbi:HNH endonuclease [Candidatus Dojkabacteria bacterium]|jgi:hypothetical protein|nr:HNH endonuclease [Candidatus Dojkabacteria bacterium]
MKNRTGKLMICTYCGKEIYMSPARQAGFKYCCASCRTSGNNKARAGKPSHNRNGTMLPCAYCGKPIYVIKSKQHIPRCCSKECTYSLRKTGTIKSCLHCGQDIYTTKYNTNKKYCSNKCYRASSTSPNPYIRIKEVLEHRLIIENVLQRKLLSTEVVHHINKNTKDNRIENLQVMISSEHTRLHNLKYKIEDGHKQCSVCKQYKDISLFYKNKFFKTGFSYLCKECDKKRNYKNHINSKCAESKKS